MKRHQIAVVSLVFTCAFAPASGMAHGNSLAVGDILTANYYGNRVVKVDPLTGAQEDVGGLTTLCDPVDLA
jgi:hypothetical protein